MEHLGQVPMFRLLLPLVAGILVAIYAQFPVPGGEWCLMGGAVFFIGWHTRRWAALHTLRGWSGLIIHLLVFGAGYQLTVAKTHRFQPSHYSHHLSDSGWVVARLIDRPVEKPKSYKVVVALESLDDQRGLTPVSGKALIYFRKSDSAAALAYGDKVMFRNQLAPVPPPGNPGQFNYRQWLSFEQIHFQAFAGEGDWKRLSSGHGNWLFQAAHRARDQLMAIFIRSNIDGPELAVLSALMLGQKDRLDPETVKAYASAGAMHVLAVSGLHVGIIFVVFNFLLRSVTRLRHGRWIRAFFLITLLWAYAFLTGLSPSVMRAATMFSFVILGHTLKRHANIYNTLSASAVFLLVFQPYLVMKVGFQLSYLAVLGIVFLHPRIYNLIDFQRRVPDHIWNITAVSLAAQVATFPLGLLYFHQFPNYFLFSNLIVIPAASLILYLGIAVFVFSGVPVVGEWLARALDYSVGLLNQFVAWIESLPYALAEGISITIVETWFLYGIMLVVSGFMVYKKPRWMQVTLMLILAMLVYRGIRVFDHKQMKEVAIYKLNRQSAFDFMDGDRSLLLADSSLLSNESEMLFQIRHHWWDRDISTSELLAIDTTDAIESGNVRMQSGLVRFYDRTLVCIRPGHRIPPADTLIPVDYMVFSGGPKLKLEKVLQRYAPARVIIDGSNSRWQAQKWLAAAEERDIETWWVAEQGAFVERWY